MSNRFANAYFHDEDAMTASSRYQNKGMVVRMALSHTHDHRWVCIHRTLSWL